MNNKKYLIAKLNEKSSRLLMNYSTKSKYQEETVPFLKLGQLYVTWRVKAPLATTGHAAPPGRTPKLSKLNHSLFPSHPNTLCDFWSLSMFCAWCLCWKIFLVFRLLASLHRLVPKRTSPLRAGLR